MGLYPPAARVVAEGKMLAKRPDNAYSWQGMLIRYCLAGGMAFCVYAVARRGVGAWYFQRKSPQALQTAIRWDPYNAQYYDALATMRHFYADNENPYEQVALYEGATSLSPQNALYWADLGTAYDWAGNNAEALRAFERAEELFPNSPDILWRLANFYVRTGKTSDGLEALRKVLAGGGVPRQDVFSLAENATQDKKRILDEVVPPEAPILMEYLDYQAKAGDIASAEQAWDRLLGLKLRFELPESFFYLDTLIQKRETERLGKAWSELGERFPEKVGSLYAHANHVANGSFESDILNGGLDWRAVPVEGASVSMDSSEAVDGIRAARIDFDGTQNVDYGHLLQYMLVRPNTRYKFSGYMRADRITTDRGPRFQVFDAYDAGKEFLETENVVGSSEWKEQKLEFKSTADTHLLVIRIARPASSKFDNKISGTVWIDRVVLKEE